MLLLTLSGKASLSVSMFCRPVVRLGLASLLFPDLSESAL